MKRKSNEAPPLQANPQKQCKRAQTIQLLTVEQRSHLLYSWPSTSWLRTRESPSASTERRSKPQQESSVSGSDSSEPVPNARVKVVILPSLHFQPFLNIGTQASGQAIDRHPPRSEVLPVAPSCQQCTKLGPSCNRAGPKCASCSTSHIPYLAADPWDFFSAKTARLDSKDEQMPKVNSKGKQREGEDRPLQRARCLFWASSIDDMRQCDPLFPAQTTPIAVNRSGLVTALLLRQDNLKRPPKLDTLVANLPVDAVTFKSLRMTLNTGALLRVYYCFHDPGKECRVIDDSVALAKVIFLRTFCIAKLEQKNESHARLTLTPNDKVDPLASGVIADGPARTDTPLPLDASQQTLLGFRCSVCGKGNRKCSLEFDQCQHCSSKFATGKDARTSSSRTRKMELHFTGSKSDLGQANMLLTEDDVTQRSVSSFSDGTRVCTYHFADLACSFSSLMEVRLLRQQHALHHVLRPSQAHGASTAALSSPPIPFVRLSREIESKLRLQGFALSFGSRSQGTCSRISSQHHPFSSASQGVLEQIACLRVSLQMANTLAHAEERAPKPLSCLFLQLQHGRLKIDASFFPTGTKSFGILSLSESTNVSLKRSKKGIFKSSSKDETFKDVSLGSFVMQPQDAVVGQADLLQALELELSSSDVSLWALANFTDPDSS